MTAWIRLIPYAESTGRLREHYDRVKGPQGNIDNVMKVHGPRPHTMEGHSALYKSVLHHTGNTLPVWFLECLGIYTSLANECDYSVAHHYAGLTRLVGKAKAEPIWAALKSGAPERAFAGNRTSACESARERHGTNARVFDQLAAHRRAAVNNLENTFRDACGVRRFAEKIAAIRCPFRRLENRRTARRQRIRRLVRGHRRRRIPRHEA